MNKKKLVGLAFGTIAGTLDVIPMIIQKLTWDANLSAKTDFKLKEFPYSIDRYYSVTSPKDSCFKLKLTINTSSTTCERHGDGELTLKSAEITGYDSTCIKPYGKLAFKIISRKNSWILLNGKTDDDSLFLDSIVITNDPDGMWLSSRYKVIPGTGSSYNFRTLVPPGSQ